MNDCNIKLIEPSEWLELSRKFQDFNYQQDLAYLNAISEKQSAELDLLGIYEGSSLVGLAGVRTKSLPIIGGGIAYIARGPLVRQAGHGMESFALVIKALTNYYSNKKKYVLRISAPIWGQSHVEQQNKILVEHGFRRNSFLTPYTTSIVDLSVDEDQLKKSFHRKWRYNLNQSLRKNLIVRSGAIEECLEDFGGLFGDHKRRKGYKVTLEPSFYRNVERRSEAKNDYIVHLVEYEGKIVSGHIGSYVGDTAVYLFGATNLEGNKVKASYLLQYRAMLKAMELGLEKYDTGGIDKKGNPGVYDFKRYMNGALLSSASFYDWCPDPLRQSILLLEGFYRQLKKN